MKQNNKTVHDSNINNGIFICNYYNVLHSFQIYSRENNIKFIFECPNSNEEYPL